MSFFFGFLCSEFWKIDWKEHISFLFLELEAFWCEGSNYNMLLLVSSPKGELEGSKEILTHQAWKNFNTAQVVWANSV